MNYLLDSIESEALKKMIDDKRKFYHKQVAAGNIRAAQFLQNDIMFLEDDILPVVLRNSNYLHGDMCNILVRAFEVAVKFDCNGLLFYVPIKADYTDQPKVGIFNSKQYLHQGTPEAMQTWVEYICIKNMDDNGVNVEPKHLPIYF